MIKQVNISELISVSIQLAGAACQIVKSYYVNKNAKQYTKGVDDYVTEADFKIQSMLIKGIKKQYPQLKIVGEQDKQYDGQIDTNYNNLNENILPQILNYETSFPIEDLCVWIDPIDCTKGFINGQIQDVTILIGISRKKKADIGIIGIPYKIINGQSMYNPSIMFGAVSQKASYEYFLQSKKVIKLPINNVSQKSKYPSLVTSCNRTTDLQKILIQKLQAKNHKCGGSGHKICMVLNQQASITTYPLSFTKKWDTCAGHAIVHSIGGYFSDCYGDQILYNHENPKQANNKGFICTLDKQLYEKTLQICLNYKKSNL